MKTEFYAYNYAADGVTHAVFDKRENRITAWFMSQAGAMRYAQLLQKAGHKSRYFAIALDSQGQPKYFQG